MSKTLVGLISKQSSSTKVIRNSDLIVEKQQKKESLSKEVVELRNRLKAALLAQDIDISEMFRRFDKNGDGVLSPFELECAFTVLEIEFNKADLRRLIKLTDSNRDGKIDVEEFSAMLYQQDIETKAAMLDDEIIEAISEASDDLEEQSEIQESIKI